MRLVALPRLRRRSFWLLGAVTWLAFFAVREGVSLERIPALATLWGAVALLAIVALTIARLHDRNRSGWWTLAALVPVAGALWLFWETALRRGTPDTNGYGPDPKAR